MLTKNSDIEWLFGGSFDPVHRGHVAIINALKNLNSGWNIRLLPCAFPALKANNAATFKQRVAMLKLATENIRKVEIDIREGERDGPSYTIDSLKSLKTEFPHRTFILVIGDDHVGQLDNWYQSQQLHDYCHCLIIHRACFKSDELQQTMGALGFEPLAACQDFSRFRQGRYLRLAELNFDISSTAIRMDFKQQMNRKNALSQTRCQMLPNAVEKYIQTYSIYR